MKKLLLGAFLLLLASCSSTMNVDENSGFIDVQTGQNSELTGVDQILKYTGNQGEPIVLIHGNAGYPSHWDRTVAVLKANGWTDAMIFRPSWGSKISPTSNDHYGSELDTVKTALKNALAKSTTGKIDVMGHSMGVTLAAKAILDLGYASKVRTFVSIAGAWRGLLSCGVYPYNVWNSTCGSNGLSVGSPLLNSLAGKRFAQYQYAIYSWVDEIVCSTGSCLIYGVHSSLPQVYDGTKAYSTVPYGHFGILYYSETIQKDWAQKY
jgi:pimeloyl-ACP methyl ester carboxylesterase